MSKPDKQRFSEALDDLGVVYDKEVSVSLKRIYWDDLGRFPIDALEAAIKTAVMPLEWRIGTEDSDSAPPATPTPASTAGHVVPVTHW